MFKITDAQEEQMLRALKGGANLTTSCYYAKIDPHDFLEFIELGETNSKSKQAVEARRLLLEVKKAKAEVLLQAELKIQSAVKDEWKAAAWYLERVLPEVYGKSGR